MHCLFCRIATHVLPALVIYEDKNIIAFLDIRPRAPGHTIVIPKHHSPTLLDLPAVDVGPLFSVVRLVADKVQRALGAHGLTIGINQGTASGQEVDHLHVHIIPRFDGDGGTSMQSVVHHTSDDSLEAIAAKIQKENPLP